MSRLDLALEEVEMRRSLCLVTLTLVGVLLTLATNDAQEPRHRIRPFEITDNLYMLSSDPASQGEPFQTQHVVRPATEFWRQ